MARGKETPEDIKALIRAELLAGMGVNEVARKYQLSPGTVSAIKRDVEQIERLDETAKQSISELLADSVRVHIEAVNTIAKQASDPAYIEKQTASDLSELHAQLASHAIRLLEAASAVGVPDEIEAEED